MQNIFFCLMLSRALFHHSGPRDNFSKKTKTVLWESKVYVWFNSKSLLKITSAKVWRIQIIEFILWMTNKIRASPHLPPLSIRWATGKKRTSDASTRFSLGLCHYNRAGIPFSIWSKSWFPVLGPERWATEILDSLRYMRVK